ncbi:MAG: hypothetical protein IT560_08035 [Alphaproteobacteria bacterium]|nr:hypothetical protein [Alphaproteobacteria bacterium]
MSDDITKLCADSLRAFTQNNHGIILKSSHAHELVAAYFGYKSRAALLADSKYPIGNLPQAVIFVMTPDAFIDQRRTELQGLPPDLPDSYKLGEGVYVPLFAGKSWTSHFPPFRSFDKLAKYMVETSDVYQQAFQFYGKVPMHHIVSVRDEDAGVTVNVLHTHKISAEEVLVDGETTINLPRVAGHIGYGAPSLSLETRSGMEREVLKIKEGRL